MVPGEGVKQIEFRVLGPLEVARGNTSLDLGPPKQRSLLALLVLHANEVLSADRIVDELWGERPPSRARHAVQVYVSGLRKVLEPSRAPGEPPDVLLTQDPGYLLRATSEDCDALRFEVLAAEGRAALEAGRDGEAVSLLSQGLDLWRGPVLADLAYEPFVLRAADRLEELRLTALETKFEAELRLGRHAEVVGRLEGLAADHPLRERIWWMLMLALYRAGRQGEALGASRRLRETLREELGLDPGPDVRELEEAILRQDPDLTWRPPGSQEEGPAPPSPEPGPNAEDPAPTVEERRLATVLFAELEGLGDLMDRLDPEDAHAVVDRCMGRLGEIVETHGGKIDSIVGGRLMAAFGAPAAHEDDPERAIRAALEMQRCAAEGEEEFPGLGLSVGVDGGEVMVAPVGSDPSGEPSLIGDAVTIASSLQDTSPTGAVYVGEATYRATRDTVTYEQVPSTRVRGRPRPMNVWRALEVARPPHSRPFGRARLVGREPELELLRTIWRRVAAEDRPHLATILGAPGVGKTRLASEFERTLRAEGARVVQGRCLPYGEALSYGPLATALEEAAGITPEDGRPSARAKLGALASMVPLPAESSPEEIARHLALLTGLDTDEDRAPGTPDQKVLHASTRRFFEGLGRREPLCLSVEDVHWADDALLDLLQSLAIRARDASLLILTQARPELLERRPDWSGGAAASTSLPLGSLNEAGIRELVDDLGGRELSETEFREVVRLSGGNPLFVEELVATFEETGALTPVPATLRSLLLARLDLLPDPEREALQLGSIFGTTFWPSGLRSLGATDPLVDPLGELERRDILRPGTRSRFRGELEYAFKHVLIRDVAYETLSRRRRRELHRRARGWIDEAAGERIHEHLDELAHHAVRADERERAIDYLSRAAEQAQRAAAHRREAELLAQAVGIAEDESPEEELADLRARRGRALARVGDWGDARPELESAVATLPQKRTEQRTEVLLELSAVCEWSGDIPGAHRHADEALALATDAGREDLALAAMGLQSNAEIADGHNESGGDRAREVLERSREQGLQIPYAQMVAYPMLLYWSGRPEEAARFAEGALAAGREAGSTWITMWNLPHLGLGLASQGEYSRAMGAFDEAVRFGREHEVWALLARSISMSAGVHLDLFDFEGAETLDEEARERARSADFHNTVVSAGVDLLFVLVRRGEVGRAVELRDEVVDDVQRGEGSHGWLWRLRFAQAEAELALARGEPDRSLELGADALERARSKRRVKYEILALSVQGAALHSLGRTKEALPPLRRAVELARGLGDPALLLRAGASVAAIEGAEDAADKAREAAQRVVSALPDGPLRRRFEGAETVRFVLA